MMMDSVVDEEDCIAIGLKIVEGAERLRTMHMVTPGAAAKWAFEMDGQRFLVEIRVGPDGEGPDA